MRFELAQALAGVEALDGAARPRGHAPRPPPAGGAIILTSAARAKTLKKKPVYVLGTGESSEHSMISMMHDMTEFREALRENSRLSHAYVLLRRMSVEVRAASTVEDLFRRACQCAIEGGNIRMCWIGVHDAATGEVRPVATAGASMSVITGFRVAFGGAQELFGIAADLTCLGKIIGAGLPVGAYGGRADLMALVSPDGPVYQAGTLSGNPLAMAAGIATLEELIKTKPYSRLEILGQRLEKGLRAVCARHGVPFTFNRCGSMWTLFFNPEPVLNYDLAKKSDTKTFARFFWAMLERGVYLPCSQFEALFVSAAHAEDDISATIAAAREALAEEI